VHGQPGPGARRRHGDLHVSTRNFPNRLGKNTNVFLGSAELAAIAPSWASIPTVAEYHEAMGIVNKDGASDLQVPQFQPDVENAKAVTA
jgi:aconitate hydratase 2/2-methylisocitrate dehydratase